MSINDDNIKSIYKSYILTRTPLSRQVCPSLEEISNIFIDSGLEAEKEKIIDHITNCSYCVQEFDVFLEIFRQEQKLVKEIDLFLKNKGGPSLVSKKNMKKTIKFALAWKLALASAIAIVLGGATFLIINGLIFNKKAEKRGDRPGQLSLLEPLSEHAAEIPLLFRWGEIAGRDYFVIEIFDESLSPLWKSTKIFVTFYRPPPDIERQIHRGRSYFWMITAFFANGLTLESHLEEFRIAD